MIKTIKIKDSSDNQLELESQSLVVTIDNIEILIAINADKVTVDMFRSNDKNESGASTELSYQVKEKENEI